MPTANEDYFDAAVRHQVGLRRYSSAEVRKMLTVLEQADKDLVRRLRERLAKVGNVSDFTGKRMKALLDDIKVLRSEAIGTVKQQMVESLEGLARVELDFEQRMIQASVPFEVEFASVAVQTVREAAFRRPFQGRLLKDWFGSLVSADQRALTSAVQIGIVNGESIPQIIQRVAGTKANGFTDGALAMTRRNAEAVVRTAVNHVSNAARESLWEGNEDIIAYKRWTATLDGRTSAICRARDGKGAPVGEKPLPKGVEPLDPPGAKPPAHVNCLPGSCLVASCGGIAAATKRFYEGKVVVIRTAAGHELTCTPNHPVLTDRGWLPAKLIDQSCRVVRYLGGQDPLARVEVENQDVPAPIEEVANALLERGEEQRVATTRGSFHGDGSDGEVSVIGADGFLVGVEDQAALSHHGIEQGLERGSRVHAPLVGGCSSTPLLKRALSPASGLVGGFDLTRASYGTSPVPGGLAGGATYCSLRRVGPRESARLLRTSQPDAEFLQQAVGGVDGDLQVSGDVVDALAGKVEFDDVVGVREDEFRGHVYNLETGSGIYFATAGSIVTHNCRSVMVAVLDGEGMLGKRPSVRDTRRREDREVDFQAEARKRGVPIQQVRKEWSKENVGLVPAETTYQDWLKRQPASFQEDVLGKERAALFRSGKMDLDEFVDRSGKELTLEELSA